MSNWASNGGPILPGPLAEAIPMLALIQVHGLPGGDRARDRVSRFQVEHRLFRCGMHARPVSREEIEPSARCVPEWAPEIADRPVAGRVSAPICRFCGVKRKEVRCSEQRAWANEEPDKNKPPR